MVLSPPSRVSRMQTFWSYGWVLVHFCPPKYFSRTNQPSQLPFSPWLPSKLSKGCRLLPMEGTSSSTAWPPVFAGSLLPSPFWKENLLQVGVLWPVRFQASPALILGDVCLGSVLVRPSSSAVDLSRSAADAGAAAGRFGVHPPRGVGGPSPGSGYLSSPRPSLLPPDPPRKTQLSQLFSTLPGSSGWILRCAPERWQRPRLTIKYASWVFFSFYLFIYLFVCLFFFILLLFEITSSIGGSLAGAAGGAERVWI